MGLVVDKTLNDGLLDNSKNEGICPHCGKTITVSMNKFEEICTHCGNTVIVEDIVLDNTINITLDDI
jgi:predicted amidophosphoribosyltransferase